MIINLPSIDLIVAIKHGGKTKRFLLVLYLHALKTGVCDNMIIIISNPLCIALENRNGTGLAVLNHTGNYFTYTGMLYK